ncbi:MAG: AraC family ligand binding domain-containing protein [Gemmatimonadota bacterium]
MRRSMLLLTLAAGLPGAALSAQEFPPSCNMCSATYVPAEELQEFLEIPQIDQQVRSLDIGKTNVQVAIAHRGRLERPGGVAEHSLVTEIYYVISGSGTNVTGPDLVGSVPRPPDNRAVRTLNGPGHNAEAIRNGQTVELKAGDVLVIPAGTGHQFTRIDDHITYLMIRVDPDKVVPLLDAEGAREYLDDR